MNTYVDRNANLAAKARVHEAIETVFASISRLDDRVSTMGAALHSVLRPQPLTPADPKVPQEVVQQLLADQIFRMASTIDEIGSRVQEMRERLEL